MAKYSFLLLLAVMLSGGCKDEVAYNLEKPKIGDRKMLVLDMTGVRCVNCPKAADEIENLKAIYGDDNIVAVGVHGDDFFGPKYKESKYDFRTDQARVFYHSLGTALGLPTGTVNYRYNSPEKNFFYDFPQWASLLAQDVTTPAQVKIDVENHFDNVSRKLTSKVTVTATTDIVRPLRITVMLTEDHIMDLQLTPGLHDPIMYDHKHVLREILTSETGDALTGSMKQGEAVVRTYDFTLPAEDGWWNADNCHIVAFVNWGTNDTQETLQAQEKSIK